MLPSLPAVAKTDGGEASPTMATQMQTFCVYRPYMESTSKEMNNDNDLNLHSITKLSGWPRHCLPVNIGYFW